MGGWEAASAGEVGGVGVSSVAVGVPVYCCNGVCCGTHVSNLSSIYCLIPLVCT